MHQRNFVILACLVVLTGCHDAETAWNDVLKHCAESALNGPHILFFGPSNAVGTGSIWRKDSEGVYRLRFDLAHMPNPKSFTGPYTPSSCDGTSSSNFDAGFNVSLDANAIAATMKNDFSKAESVTAKAGSIAWVPIVEGAFENYVNNLPATSAVSKDLRKGATRYVMTRALKVSGFSTNLTFSDSDAAALNAKYPNGPLSSNLAGNLGGGLTAKWTHKDTLTIKSAGDFYIAGEFQPYTPGGFASASLSHFGPKVKFDSDAKAERDTP